MAGREAKEALRQQLVRTIFRGRRRPAVDELLRSSTAVVDSTTEEDPRFMKEVKWERVTLHLHDESDPSQTELNLLIATSRNKPPLQTKGTICILHATSKSCDTDEMLDILARFALSGFMVVGLNSRYHGCRRGEGYEGKERYLSALVQAWKGNSDFCTDASLYPFIYDTAADLFSVADYVTSRPDVNGAKLGITGISLGGMHAWFAAAADPRWTAVAPLIGVQSFCYAVENACFEARVASIQDVFDSAAVDLGWGCISSDVVRSVWNRICPGLLEHFDGGRSLALLSPRPVFIGNGELDPRCPIKGVEAAVSYARETFKEECADPERLELHIYKNVGHEVTEDMMRDCLAFFEKVFPDDTVPYPQFCSDPTTTVIDPKSTRA